MKKITKKKLKEGYKHSLTVGRLKKFLTDYNLPDGAKVVVQRVEDRYYENHGWSVYLKEDPFNSPVKDENGNSIKCFCQYTPAWSCVKYADEDDVLFIDLHY